MVAAREYCDTMLSARLTAEGLCWQAYSNDKFAIGSTKVTGRNIRDAASNQDKSISWAKTRDEATLKAPGITDIIVSGTRIRCLQAICGTVANLSAREGVEMMARALRWCLKETCEETGFVGQVHPSHRAWFAEYLKIESEFLQTPCTVTSGIFDSRPTFVAESIPPEDRLRWGELEDIRSREWRSIPWQRNGMACIRSGDTGITEAVMEKARQSAKAGYRILLLLEYGQAEKGSAMSMGVNSVPIEMRDSVRDQHVIHYPSQQLLWAGSSGWKG